MTAPEIVFDDHKIAVAVKHCKGRDVLDIGCVGGGRDPAGSPYWLHKAIAAVASSVTGLDNNAPAVAALQAHGYNIVVGDAESFQLDRLFDVIVAADVIDLLQNLRGFIDSCKRHLRPGGQLLISSKNPWYWRNTLKAGLRREVSGDTRRTCWVCPRTLRQLLAPHDFQVREVTFGSRSLLDRGLPLPAAWKHGDYHADVVAASGESAGRAA